MGENIPEFVSELRFIIVKHGHERFKIIIIIMNLSKNITSKSLNDYTINLQSSSYMYLGRSSNRSMDLSEWCLLRQI